MQRRFKVDPERLKRFSFEPFAGLQRRIAEDHDLKRRLQEDLPGTLEEEGIVVDDAFRQMVSDQWHAQIEADTRLIMATIPENRKPYYRMVQSGEPVKVRVSIDPKTGEITTVPREEGP
ncbi:hypothetical protein RJ53_10345 [Methanocalculus chunghsingensis]|uniref:Uncharacterized protein n=1 Tax=Methanocalculus chunghsingensis TaxID=156457 RepID=A0A8J7W7K0_9EURY|nr:hypothetical protein [Methanocalculus chunghsingensis]MBR1369854.1 hypothetical protein [Methanocalculus chunghsingensis]